MGNNQFRTTITDNGEEITGTLQLVDEENITQEKEFDPLTVLGDLLNVVGYEQKSPYPQHNYHFKENYTKHPFFFDTEYTIISNSKMGGEFERTHFFVAFDLLREIICNNPLPRKYKGALPLDEFEVIKQFLQLKFTLEILFQEENPLYDWGYKENPFNGETVSTHQYLPLSEIKDFNIGQLTNIKTPYRFVYSCNSVEEIVFSVLHYLIFFGYTFVQCEHCGKYFAAKSKKQQYCKRKSPYEGYTHLQCEQAVRNILNKCRQRKKSIDRHLISSYGYAVASKFGDEYKKYMDAARACSSVENLQQLELFLCKENIKKNWYDASKRRPSPHNNRKNP